METMVKIINALSALTAALQEYTAQTTNGYINTFEEIYNPEKDDAPTAEQPTPETKAVTFVELRSRLAEISRAGHTAEIKELIARFGAEKLSDVAEADYAALLTEAEGL